MEENNTTSSSNSGGSKKGLIIAAALVIVILVVAGGGFAFLKMGKENPNEEMKEPVSAENAESQTQAQVSVVPTESTASGTPTLTVTSGKSAYKDGTYTATGTYSHHAGNEQIGVTITLKDGKVSEVSVQTMAKAPTSKIMQADFAANYKTLVVGKNIDEVKLGKVSGSSLTGIGFNAAVEQIKTQAHS